MAKVITLNNQKGGVGKSTISVLLGEGLAIRNFRVLIIDLDKQMNTTNCSGIEPESIEQDIMDILQFAQTFSLLPPDVIKSTIKKSIFTESPLGFDIIPGSKQCERAYQLLINKNGEQDRLLLKSVLLYLKEDYDFIIIDTPPSLDILSQNALTACDSVIIPAEAAVFSISALKDMIDIIEALKMSINPNIKIEGILLNRVERTNLAKDMIYVSTAAAKALNTKVFSQTIRRGAKVVEAQTDKFNIFERYPNENVVQDLNGFIDEFLKGEN